MTPNITEKIIWLFGVSNIPTDEGITIASNSATTNKPTMIKENNNLKLNACWLLVLDQVKRSTSKETFTFFCHFFAWSLNWLVCCGC